MLYLGIGILIFGIVLLVATQLVLRKLIQNYKKTWERKR